MTASDLEPHRTRLRRPTSLLWILAGLVVVALVVGLVIAALRPPTSLDIGRPEGVVQAYLQAVLEHDHAAATGYLSEATAERCPASAFRATWVPEGLTADLDDVQVTGDRAEVRVVLHPNTALPPFEAVDSTTELFRLTREVGAWRFTGIPWPLVSCEGQP
ncbi:MAG TPA: hypothetical protein VK923_15505 [Euzebyales bacterium]|nr:hypothetical protein [Euzebyales bacterium]